MKPKSSSFGGRFGHTQPQKAPEPIPAPCTSDACAGPRQAEPSPFWRSISGELSRTASPHRDRSVGGSVFSQETRLKPSRNAPSASQPFIWLCLFFEGSLFRVEREAKGKQNIVLRRWNGAIQAPAPTCSNTNCLNSVAPLEKRCLHKSLANPWQPPRKTFFVGCLILFGDLKIVMTPHAPYLMQKSLVCPKGLALQHWGP